MNHRTPAGLADVVRIVLSRAEIPPPPKDLLLNMLAAAVEQADPVVVWQQLPAEQTEVAALGAERALQNHVRPDRMTASVQRIPRQV